ncbi:MAG: GDSL-type esterase/lipase family protein [Candidatus Phosphoribacter sp.]
MNLRFSSAFGAFHGFGAPRTRRTFRGHSAARISLVIAGLVGALMAGAPPYGAAPPANAATAGYLAVLGDSIASASYQSSPGATSPKYISPGWATRLGDVGPASVDYADLTRGGSYLALDNVGAGIPAIFNSFAPMIQSLPNCTAAIVAAGRNDLFNATDQQLQAAVQSIDSQARTLGVKVAFLTILPAGAVYGSYGITEPQRVRFNAWLKATYPQQAVDAEPVLDVNHDGLLDSHMDSGDGFHLNSEGSARVASAASAFLARQAWVPLTVRGSVDSATPDPDSIHVVGWAMDETAAGIPPVISATVDGTSARIGGVRFNRLDVPRYVNNDASPSLGFSMWVAASPGWHIVCVFGAPSTGGRVLLARGCRQVYVAPPPTAPDPPECPVMTTWRMTDGVWSMSLWCQGQEFLVRDVSAVGQVRIVLPDGRTAWVDGQLNPAKGPPQMTLFISTTRSFWLRMDVVGTTSAGRWATMAESWNAPGHHLWVNGTMIF